MIGQSYLLRSCQDSSAGLPVLILGFSDAVVSRREVLIEMTCLFMSHDLVSRSLKGDVLLIETHFSFLTLFARPCLFSRCSR